jgi:hypothetical protein
MSAQGNPEIRKGCPLPPANTLNFTEANGPIFTTLQSIARNAPNYPLPVGSNSRQIAEHRANVVYFNDINQRTAATVSSVRGGIPNLEYPKFQSESQRIQYRQGLATTAQRTQITGQNPAVPMGGPLSTNYQIINGTF